MLGRGRRQERHVDYWPGFVDALSTMLLVIVFLLCVFMLSQFFLSQEMSGKDSAIVQLNRHIDELTQLLALERNEHAKAEENLSVLSASLAVLEKEKEHLVGSIAGQDSTASNEKLKVREEELAQVKATSNRALLQIETLNAQIAALRRQLTALEQALNASESREKESQVKISNLGARLNVALAQKVQELSRYRSDFFGRLREILGNRKGIKEVGDRFVFDSEVLFETGQATLNEAGKEELDKLAEAILQLERDIPSEILWVLRIDGHTDKRPIQSYQFRSNWELSAARAISVVQYLITKHVSPQRLVAAGFGEFQPLDPGTDEASLQRNRRIELKLTER